MQPLVDFERFASFKLVRKAWNYLDFESNGIEAKNYSDVDDVAISLCQNSDKFFK